MNMRNSDIEAVSAHIDVLPTLAELGGTRVPAESRIDGLSVVSALKGGAAPQHDHLYWELHEGRFSQAAIQGRWKAIRPGPAAALELYDLETDPGESKDVASEHPDKVKGFEALLKKARTPSPLWPTDLGAKKNATLQKVKT